MASTGLLGFNPYQQGVAIDISSKPTQLAIQLQQKEQAKAEALDKYFKDYEKSINPAGLSNEEVKIFLDKFNKVKEYAIKNREQILYPAKYGYDAQANLTAGYKDLFGYIEGGKQANAERKAYNDFLNKAKASGKLTSDNVIEIGTNAAKPYGAGYVKPDISQIQIFDPHDDIDFVDKTWKGVPLKEEIITKKEIINKKPTGKEKDVLVESITPEIANMYSQRARGYFRDNLGTQKQYNILFQDKDFVNTLNQKYRQYFNTDIKTPEDLSVAYGLASKQTVEKDKTAYDYPKATYMKMASDLTQSRQRPYYGSPTSQIGNILDNFGSTNPIIYPAGGTKIEKGIVTNKDGSLFNGKVFISKENIPADLYTALANYGINKDYLSVNEGFEALVRDGRIQGLRGEDLPYIDRITVENAQKKLDTERKGEPGMGFSNIVPPTSVPKNKEKYKTTSKGNVR